MFGYLMALPQQFDEPSLKRYRSLYCGLCHTLGTNYGLAGRLTLQYDFTFLAALLFSLQPNIQTHACKRCIVHPIKPTMQCRFQALDYCACVNVLLAYEKLDDDWRDDHSFMALIAKLFLRKAQKKAVQRYPDIAGEISRSLKTLSLLENRGEPSIDLVADCFGALMGTLFVPEMLMTCREQMYALGCAIGKWIYVLDAYMDLRQDLRKGRYNPLSFVTAPDDQVLTMLAAQAVQIYQQLPLTCDRDMLDTILYHGVWNRYERWKIRRAKRDERRNAKA